MMSMHVELLTSFSIVPGPELIETHRLSLTDFPFLLQL